MTLYPNPASEPLMPVPRYVQSRLLSDDSFHSFVWSGDTGNLQRLRVALANLLLKSCPLHTKPKCESWCPSFNHQAGAYTLMISLLPWRGGISTMPCLRSR